MGIENIGSIGAIVSGSNNSVTAGAGNARLHTTENIANTRVDYSAALPTILEWKEHFKRESQQEIVARLDQLEQLMKSGTPTEKDRFKLSEVLSQLAAIFSASTQALAFFDGIRKLAGI